MLYPLPMVGMLEYRNTGRLGDKAVMVFLKPAEFLHNSSFHNSIVPVECFIGVGIGIGVEKVPGSNFDTDPDSDPDPGGKRAEWLI